MVDAELDRLADGLISPLGIKSPGQISIFAFDQQPEPSGLG